MPRYRCIFHNDSSIVNYAKLRYIDPQTLDRISKIILFLFNDIIDKSKKKSGIITDAGVGSGRLFIPLIKNAQKTNSKTKFIGIDISSKMLDSLNQEIKLFSEKNILIVKHDLRKQFPSFLEKNTIVYSLATLHIIWEWKKTFQNIIQTLLPNGKFLLLKEINQFMHQTEGFEGNNQLINIDSTLQAFMEEYHYLRNKFSIPFRRNGILYSDFSNGTKELSKLGYDLSIIKNESKLSWKKPHSYFYLLESFRNKTVTTWGTDIKDENIRSKIFNGLNNWLITNNVDLNNKFYLNSRIELYVYSRN